MFSFPLLNFPFRPTSETVVPLTEQIKGAHVPHDKIGVMFKEGVMIVFEQSSVCLSFS